MGSKKPKIKDDSEKVEKEEKSKEKKVVKKKKMIEGIRGRLRIAEIDVAGEKKLKSALYKIKGVGKSLSKCIIKVSGLDPEAMIGSLSDEQIKKLEEIIKEPAKYGIPAHMLNRRKDVQTGKDIHLSSSELSFIVKSDIDLLKKIKCYKGVRHDLGLPVRGQRTRSSFRKNKTVGVVKKKMMPGAKPAAPAK